MTITVAELVPSLKQEIDETSRFLDEEFQVIAAAPDFTPAISAIAQELLASAHRMQSLASALAVLA